MESYGESAQFVVQPYMFEPPARQRGVSESENSSDSGDESESTDCSDNDNVLDEARVGNVEWCTCHSCVPSPTAVQCMCCREFPDLKGKLEERGIQCIVSHEGFSGNCLNPDVIKVSFYEFLQENGPIGDEEHIHEIYRHLAFRRLARWIWHRLLKKEQRPLPACAVNAIRKRFPPVENAGFRYAAHDLL